MNTGLIAIVALPVLAVLLAGCPPRCARTCEKVLDCELGSHRVAQSECEVSCLAQQDLYDGWESEQKQQAFDDHRRCIMQSSCDELRKGECYDSLLFINEEAPETI